MGTHRNILIASGENYPDALSASALAVEKDMNIILTGKDKIADSVKEYLRENKKDLFKLVTKVYEKHDYRDLKNVYEYVFSNK